MDFDRMQASKQSALEAAFSATLTTALVLGLDQSCGVSNDLGHFNRPTKVATGGFIESPGTAPCTQREPM